MRQPVGVVFADEQPALLNGGRNRASAFQSLGKRSKLANGGGPPPAVMKGANGKALNGHGGNKQQQPEVVYPPSSGPPPTKGIMKSSRNSNNQQREKEKAQCPHGFQLDLDFVKFAEDVATGREQIQKWSSPSKRARHIMASPVPSFASPNHLNTTNSDCCPDSSLDDRLNNSSSIMLDSSILSKSMDEPTSELEEILNHPRELVQHDATPPPHRSSSNSNNNNNLQQQQQSRKQWGGRVPQSILKHSSNNNSESPFVPIPAPPQSIISSSYSHFQQQQQPHQSNSSHSRQQQQHQYHQPRGYIDSSQTTPRRYTTLSSAAGRGHSMDAHLASATLPYPPPSRKDSDEVRNILGSKFSSNTGNTSTPSGSPIPGATSAGGPPKPYYTAIAHSMAQLRKIPIGQPRNYGFRPSQFSSAAASKTNGNGGGTAPYRYFNYLETAASNRRSRVLSPEPMESGQSGALRHSNLQSRSYFHGGASSHGLPTITTMNDSSSDKYGGGGNGRIPYRQRGPSNSISTLFDGFASVRRKRMDELTSLGQFEATSELLRSLSPPRNVSTPKLSSAEDNADETLLPFGFDYIRHSEDASSFFIPRRSQTLPPRHHLYTTTTTPMESTEQTNYAAADDEDSGGTKKRVTTTTKATLENHGVQTSVLSLQNAETQTVKEKKTMTKNIGVGTNGFPETEKTAAVKVVVETTDSSTSPQPTPPPLAMTTVGVDTTDLVPPSSKKKVPPPPPPKPKEVNLDELKKRHLGMEFQFCLGHEPEHHPDEEPPYIVVVGEEHQPSAVAEESSKPEMIDRGSSPIEIDVAKEEQQHPIAAVKSQFAEETDPSSVHPLPLPSMTNTDEKEEMAAIQMDLPFIALEIGQQKQKSGHVVAAETQTDAEWLNDQIKQMAAEEKALKRRSVDKVTETDDTGGPVNTMMQDEFIMITCGGGYDRSSLEIDEEIYEKIIATNPELVEEKGSETSEKSDNLPSIIEEFQYPPHEEEDVFLSKSQELPQLLVVLPMSHEPISRQVSSSAEGTSTEEELPEIDADRVSRISSISTETDTQTVIRVDTGRGRTSTETTDELLDSPTSRQVDPLRAEAVRKLLTEQQRSSPFQRDVASYRSYRMEKGKANDLEYIAERHTNKNEVTAEPSTPSSSSSNGSTKKALKEMVNLKKTFSSSSSNAFSAPEPIPAKIPRPKFAKYSTVVEPAETPDEVEEAADRLTPLRSEMRSLTSWGSPTRNLNRISPLYFRPSNLNNELVAEDDDIAAEFSRHGGGGDIIDDDECDASSSSSEGNRTYEMSEHEECSAIRFGSGEFELSPPLRDAIEMINESLRQRHASSPTDWAYKYTQHEWLKLATKRNANAELVEAFIDALEALSTRLMEIVVNMTDQNGNTALHYAVSHENYDVVSVLLDSKVCRVDEMNKAGYSAIMLGALCELKNETEIAIIQRLFQMGNVNAKALKVFWSIFRFEIPMANYTRFKHRQTALMLASAHGRVETTNLLLDSGADVNIQDTDGSTALMGAAEHGQKEIVKILLKQPNIDASLTDCDSQTALSIAVENQHRDIGVLIYAHLNFSRLEHNDNSVAV